MDRKNFLKYSGFVLLSAVGFKSVVNILTQLDDRKTLSVVNHSEASRGFGGGKYGV